MKRRKCFLLIAVLMICMIMSGCAGSSSFQSPLPEDHASKEDYAGISNDETEEASEAGAGSAEQSGESKTQDITPEDESAKADVQAKKKNQKLVYTCRIHVETLEYSQSLAALKKAIDQYEGIIENEQEETYNNSWDKGKAKIGRRENTLTVRIPTEHYKEFVESAGDYGTITSKSSNVENITKSYNDVQVRIKALEVQEERLMGMLKKADSINDMITVEQRLTEVQTELNSYKTQLASMDTDVAYSTVYFELSEVEEYSNPEEKPSFGQEALEAFFDSFARFVTFIQRLLIALIYLLPYAVAALLILAIVFLLGKYLPKPKKRKKQKKNNNKMVPETDHPTTEDTVNEVQKPQEKGERFRYTREEEDGPDPGNPED